MIRLILLRHGAAEDAGPATDHRDEPRPLSAAGAARVREVAAGMRVLDLGADALLTSPLARCRQTADLVGAALGLTPREEPRLAPGMGLDVLADVLLGHPDAERVLVCGHQPDLSQVVADLTGGGAVRMSKAAVAVLDVDAMRAGGARLSALHPPAALALMGAAASGARDGGRVGT